MNITHISDTHGKHRLLELPGGDVLVHSGDFSELGMDVETESFLNWFRQQPYQYKILIAGNHDRTLFEVQGSEESAYDLEGIYYLNHSGVEIEGVAFYGAPSTPLDFPMAFCYYPEDAEKVWCDFPKKVDVLITHGPAKGILDNGYGCHILAKKIEQLVGLQAHLFGHVHEAKGMVNINGAVHSNASSGFHLIELKAV